MIKRLLLIIYILSWCTSNGQDLSLQYKGTSTSNQPILDSLHPNLRFKNFQEISRYNDSIINHLQQRGYINLLTHPFKKQNDSTFIQKLKLGDRYKTSVIIHNSNNDHIDSLVDITLSRKHNKNIIQTYLLNKKLQELQNHLYNRGYPFAEITVTDQKHYNKDTLNISISINSGKINRIDSIAVKGYPNFPKRYIENLIKKKLILNDKNVERVKRQFEQMSFLKITKEPEILFQQDKTTLYIYAQKQNNNAVDGLIGFNNNQTSRKLELNGYIDINLNNNLNNGEQLHLDYRGDDGDQTKLDININLPYLLRSKIGVETGLNLLRRDSTYQNTTFNGGLFYSINPVTNTGISYTSISSTTEENTNSTSSFTTRLINADLNHTINSSDQIFIYDERAQIKLGIGTRNTENIKTNQLKIEVLLLKHLIINQRHSIYSQFNTKYLNNNNILFNELYQIGGINSIRGFNQNSIDTSFFTALNTEYRYRVSRGIYLHTILDYGIFEDFNSKKTENIYGIGVGTAILTQSGILRLSIANGAFSRANLDLSSVVAHINLQIKF